MENSVMEKVRVTVLIVNEGRSVSKNIESALEAMGLGLVSVSSVIEAMELIKNREFDLVISEVTMSSMAGLEFMRTVQSYQPDTHVILISEDASAFSAGRAMSLRTFHYLKKPFDPNELIELSKLAVGHKKLRTKPAAHRKQVEQLSSVRGIIGTTPRMKKISDLIKKVASSTVPVLIQGAIGTGRKLIARSIHRHSDRSRQEFLTINIPSLPEDLLERELFGYRKGAFTGAEDDRMGLLESAGSGTLYLEEISSMSKSLQGKLLHAIEQGEIIRIGDIRPVKISVRIICATSLHLKRLVEERKFREELYWRLSVVEINVPSLRERLEDLSLMVRYFVKKFSLEHNVPEKAITRGALKLLLEHNWPGNIRELENVLNRAVVTAESRVIRQKDIVIKKTAPVDLVDEMEDIYSMKYDEAVRLLLGRFQVKYLNNHFSSSGGNISLIARRTGVTRQTLYNLMRKHNFKRKRSKAREISR